MLSVRVENQLKIKLSLNVDREIFWTDSQVELGNIKNETKKFKIFVESRVQFIQDNTKKDQWRYIQTKQNPADLASRGIEADSADKFMFGTMDQTTYGLMNQNGKNMILTAIYKKMILK